jgi:hypothetical protein
MALQNSASSVGKKTAKTVINHHPATEMVNRNKQTSWERKSDQKTTQSTGSVTDF